MKYIFTFHLLDDVAKARQRVYMQVPDYEYSISGDNLTCSCAFIGNSTKAAHLVQELGWDKIPFTLNSLIV
jgi:hypothetical protein